MSALELELSTYAKHLPQLLPQEGKYVLIHSSDIVGTFDSYGDAIKEGYEKFGLTPFLVKQISPAERVLYFTRDIDSLCQASM